MMGFLYWLVLNPHLVATLCSSFSRDNVHKLLICSSPSTAQCILMYHEIQTKHRQMCDMFVKIQSSRQLIDTVNKTAPCAAYKYERLIQYQIMTTHVKKTPNKIFTAWMDGKMQKLDQHLSFERITSPRRAIQA